jgi:uncharacterized protein YukE
VKIGKFALLVGFVSVLITPPTVFAQAKQTKASATHSDAAAMLKQDMRKLWTDHVVWTRDYVIAATEKQPDASSALNRLMKNQEDIGNAVAKYYGGAAGRELTTLLKDHIAIAGDIVKAAMAGDQAGQKAADDRWHQNATEIADVLSRANSNWPRATLLDLMNTHLSTTTTEVVARLNNDWDGDVKAFDAVYDHILHMSDALSDGIVKQFPEKFGNAVVSTTGR